MSDVTSQIASSDATLNVTLGLCDRSSVGVEGANSCGPDGNPTPLATGTVALVLGANVPAHAEVPLTPLSHADLVPWRPDTTLVLDIELESATIIQSPDFERPQVTLATKRSLLQLPLVEYHDPVDQSFQEIDSLALSAVGPAEKLVNPGEVTMFEVEITSAVRSSFDLGLTGHNLAWVSLEAKRVSVAPGEKIRFHIAAEAPVDASEGERAEVFVVAQDRENVNRVALTRLRASVIDPAHQDIADERNVLNRESTDTPALAFALTVLAISLLAVSRRPPTA